MWQRNRVLHSLATSISIAIGCWTSWISLAPAAIDERVVDIRGAACMCTNLDSVDCVPDKSRNDWNLCAGSKYSICEGGPFPCVKKAGPQRCIQPGCIGTYDDKCN